MSLSSSLIRGRHQELKCPQKTGSMWTYILAHPDQFQNPQYKSSTSALWPSTSIKKISLWSRYYSRWDPDVHPRYVHTYTAVLPNPYPPELAQWSL